MAKKVVTTRDFPTVGNKGGEATSKSVVTNQKKKNDGVPEAVKEVVMKAVKEAKEAVPNKPENYNERDKNLSEPYDPVAYEIDRITCTNIFSRKVWQVLFDKLEQLGCHNQLLEICNTSPYLRQLLLPSRTLFLFPKVWNILGKVEEDENTYLEVKKFIDDLSNSLNSDKPNVADNKHKFTVCESCGRKRREQWFSWILNLRLVCRTWTKVIDTYCQQPEIFLSYEARLILTETFVEHWSTCKIGDTWSDYAKQFCEHFEDTHKGKSRSPFISNAVSFAFTGDFMKTDLESRFNLIMLLRKYGSHAHTCRIEVLLSEGDQSLFYMANLFLAEMPKLVHCEILFGQDEAYPQIREELDEIAKKISQKSLPVDEIVWESKFNLKSEIKLSPELDSLIEKHEYLKMKLKL